jgi:hypothetical protein
MIGEVTYRLIAYTPVIRFKDIFVEHFNLHQFGVMIHDGCEKMVHGIQTMLNLHLDWVVLKVDVYNAFNLMSWSNIFQELFFFPNYLDNLFPFVQQFYAFPSSQYIFLGSCYGDFIIISSKLGT